jgi:hypothetical protein
MVMVDNGRRFMASESKGKGRMKKERRDKRAILPGRKDRGTV